MKLKDLQDRRGRVVSEMRSLTDAPEGSNGDLSDAQAQRFDELRAENERLETQITRQQAIDDAERRMGGEPVQGDAYEAQLGSFSIRKALAGAAGLDVDWGREREISQECARRMGKSLEGVMIPLRAGEQRNTTVSGDVPNLIPTDHLAQSFIDKLRSRVVVTGLGATMLSDLRGDVEIPGMGASHTAHWFAEDNAIPLSKMGDRKVTLTPKHVGARTELSRNTLLQTSPEIEQLVQNDFAAIVARAVDKVALEGGGTNEPTGILGTTGVTEVTAFEATWDKIQELIGTLEDADATGTAFTCRPSIMRTLRTTNRVENEPEHGFIAESRESLDGFPVARTTHMKDDTLLFGNFADVLIGMWGGVEVLANPYAEDAYSKGNVQYRIIQTLDVAIRHPESFAYGDLSAE